MTGASRNGSSALEFILASANMDKAAEIVEIVRSVAGDSVVLLPRPDSVPDVEETGATLEENALLKAVALTEATGLASMADDTGLFVDALDGAPGVYSARYSGENATYASNVAKLLDELDRVGAATESERAARFVTVALANFPDGTRVVAEGETQGHIALVSSGTQGFGYDPVFIPDTGDGRTYAEMSPEEKHSLSHRGRAFRALAVGLSRSGEIGL
jgi:XTP/dITP diphosphohydrolase